MTVLKAMWVHNNLLGGPGIRLPFWLFSVPMVVPKEFIWLENWVNFHVQRRECWHHAVEIMTLANRVILERDSVKTPVLQSDWLDAGKSVKWPPLEFNHRLVIRRGSFWENQDWRSVALLVFLLTSLDGLSNGDLFFLCACSLKENAINGLRNWSNTRIAFDRNLTDKTWEEISKCYENIHPANMVANDCSHSIPLRLESGTKILLIFTFLNILKVDPDKASQQSLSPAADKAHAPDHKHSEWTNFILDADHEHAHPYCVEQ